MVQKLSRSVEILLQDPRGFFSKERKKKIEDIISDIDEPIPPLTGLGWAQVKGEPLNAEKGEKLASNAERIVRKSADFFTEERKKKIEDIISDIDEPIPPLKILGLAMVTGEPFNAEEGAEFISRLMPIINGSHWVGKETIVSAVAESIKDIGTELQKMLTIEHREQIFSILVEQSLMGNDTFKRAVLQCIVELAVSLKDVGMSIWIAGNAKKRIGAHLDNQRNNNVDTNMLECEREMITSNLVETHLSAIIRSFLAHSDDTTLGPVLATFGDLITDRALPMRGRTKIFEPLEEILKIWEPKTPVSINLLSQKILEFAIELGEAKMHNASNYIGSTVRWFNQRPSAFQQDNYLATLIEESHLEIFKKKLFDVNVPQNSAPRELDPVLAEIKEENVDDSSLPTTTTNFEELVNQKQENLSVNEALCAFEDAHKDFLDLSSVKQGFTKLQKYISTCNPWYGNMFRKILLNGDCEDQDFQQFIGKIVKETLTKEEFEKLIYNFVQNLLPS